MVKINMTKARGIAHTARRAKRDSEYMAIDSGSMHVQLSADGEALRLSTKTADDQAQADIDDAKTVGELKAVMVDAGLV